MTYPTAAQHFLWVRSWNFETAESGESTIRKRQALGHEEILVKP